MSVGEKVARPAWWIAGVGADDARSPAPAGWRTRGFMVRRGGQSPMMGDSTTGVSNAPLVMVMVGALSSSSDEQ